MFARPRSRHVAVLGFLAILVLTTWRTWGRSFGLFEPVKPNPDVVNIRYGPYERNVFDLWKARPKPGQTGPAPLVVFFHGGGFRSGDKSTIPAALVVKCLDAGISVASANYRLSQTAPYPAPMLDGGRVVQFVRFKAADFGIDSRRIAAAGSSAGAGIALWVGLHDDLADHASRDPVARESSRVTAVATDGAQTSYDPRFIKSLIGGRAHEHSALRSFFGITSDADFGSSRAHELYEAASPVNYVTADDPPVFLFYTEPDAPLPPDAKPGQGIHHPRFGRALKAKLEPAGVECILRHRDEYPSEDDPNDDMCRDITNFFIRHLQ